MGKPDPRESKVLQVPAAEPGEAEAYFLGRLALETDPSDVHDDLSRGVAGFVLLDCRPAEAYAAGHIPGAVSFPYATMTPEAVGRLARDATYVTYDASLYDNACTKAALRLATLGLRVKEMMAGFQGWVAEGYPTAKGMEPGRLPVKPALQRVGSR